MDTRKVTAAVRIKLALNRPDSSLVKVKKLQEDLRRLRDSMSQEEHNEYVKRIS